jgi:hypothetical protein
MGKEFDELSKALARGVSRRAALRRFVLGSLGAVAASLIPGRSSFAGGLGEQCVELCRQAGCEGADFGKCVAACEQGDINFNIVFNACR